jgi:hypothetical protein
MGLSRKEAAFSSSLCRAAGMRVDMRRIIRANIERLKELLKTETDSTKRAMETRLLTEEEVKLQQLPAYNKNETKAY